MSRLLTPIGITHISSTEIIVSSLRRFRMRAILSRKTFCNCIRRRGELRIRRNCVKFSCTKDETTLTQSVCASFSESPLDSVRIFLHYRTNSFFPSPPILQSGQPFLSLETTSDHQATHQTETAVSATVWVTVCAAAIKKYSPTKSVRPESVCAKVARIAESWANSRQHEMDERMEK